MIELVERRTESSKTFDLGKGKCRLESKIGAIHYKDNYADPTEAWKDIDLTPDAKGNITKALYELTREDKKLTFKDKKTGEVSTIELLSANPAGIPFEIIPELSAVRFQHILPSDKVPFEAQFKVTGKSPITRDFDDDGELELETSLVDGVLTEKLSEVKDRDTGEVRPAKGNIRIDPTWQVGANKDDCYRRLVSSYWSLTNYSFFAGAYSDESYQYGSGARFTNITIPQGKTITQSYLTLRCRLAEYNAEPVNTRISAEDVDDAPTFSTVANFDTRWAARTTARVDWDNIPVWTADKDYNSPDIKTVIQEIVDRENWASGNDLVIFWDDFDDRSPHANNMRGAYSYNGSTTYAPKLVIEYTAGGPTLNAYNKILYTSEPPTPNAWNQLKQEAGVGWKKLLYV